MTQASADAAFAAAAARVEVRPARAGDHADVVALFDGIWGKGENPDPSMLRALEHAGTPNVVAERSGAIVGAAVAFLAWGGGLHAHSHIAAVDPAARGGVGRALKLAQRASCLEHGIGEMRWTVDPLVRRNARLNFHHLGAEVLAFRPDFYGVMGDDVNGGGPSDRFELRWRLRSPRVERAIAGEPARQWAAVGNALSIPADIEALRATDPELALAERMRSGTAIAAAQLAGLRPEFVGDAYVFTRDAADRR